MKDKFNILYNVIEGSAGTERRVTSQMMNKYTLEVLPYYLCAALSIFFFVFLIITASMFARQKSSTYKPNEYLSNRLVFYTGGYTKKLKVCAMITFFGFLVLLPTAIAYGIGWVCLDDRGWIPAAVTFGIAFVILIIIGTRPFSYKESCLVIDEQKVTVKYKDGEMEDKVFYVSKYDHFIPETKYVAARLVFNGYEGDEELSLHFLRRTDTVTVATMIDFIKKNGRMPVVQQVASKQEAQRLIAEQHKTDTASFAQAQQELYNDGPRFKAYLENVLAKMPEGKKDQVTQLVRQNRKLEAIKEVREYTGEGLYIAKELVERYFC